MHFRAETVGESAGFIDHLATHHGRGDGQVVAIDHPEHLGADRDGAVAVLREAIDLGITHIDTSNAYGPAVTNQLIREALHPYPESLHVVTKVGANRDQHGGWPPA